MATPERAPERVVLVRTRTVLAVLGITVLVALALGFLYLARHAITWILIAAFLAMALNPAVEFFEGRGLRRGLAAALVFLLALLGATVLGLLVIPPLVTEVTDFVEAVPSLVADITAGRGPLGFLERDYGVVERVRSAVEQRGAGGILGVTEPAVAVLRGIVTTVVGIVAIAFLTFFMLLEGRRWATALVELLPPGSRARWERVGGGVYRAVGGYVTGNLLISLVAGTLTTIVLLIVGVDYAIALGLVVAILDLVPLAGATLAGALVTLIAFLDAGLIPALIVLVFFVVYQQLENHVLQPFVYGRTVQLSPLTVLVAILIGAEVAGILGALAAIPVGGSVQVVLNELLRHRRAEPSGVAAPPGG
ncbi:MAG TPA: AI-2E family transporter [Gaiellaceae bacterium]|nr:AI-2E family transporter [Gaiellaceae bacterium]